MNAEPNCNRHAISPTSLTARFAQVPRKMPNAVHTCQLITRPPRTLVGEFSAEKTGTVTSFRPIPMPKSTRQATSWPQVCVTAIPKGATKLKMAAMKIVPRRPSQSLKGSEIQAVLYRRQSGSLGSREVHLQECNGNVWGRIHEANDPGVSITVWFAVAEVRDAEFLGKRQICAIGASLIPTLNGSSDGVHDNREIEGPGMAPSMGDFVAKPLTIIVVEFWDVLEVVGRLGDEGAFAKQREDVGQLIFFGVNLDISEELLSRNARKGVANPVEYETR